MIQPNRLARRRAGAQALSGLAVSLLAIAPLGATVEAPVFRATLRLNKEKYQVNDVPLLCFESNGSARIAGYILEVKEAQLSFSPDPSAATSSPYPPLPIGTINGLGNIEYVLPVITCTSQESFIQGLEIDVATGQLVSFTNEVQILIDRTGCDPTQPGQGAGGQACPPGVWKQDANLGEWPVPITPDLLFGAVFEDAFPGMTLLDVLRQGGGPLNAMGRQSVAAMLNAESALVDFDLSAREVIDGFDAVFPGTKAEYSAQATFLKNFNNQGGCYLVPPPPPAPSETGSGATPRTGTVRRGKRGR